MRTAALVLLLALAMGSVVLLCGCPKQPPPATGGGTTATGGPSGPQGGGAPAGTGAAGAEDYSPAPSLPEAKDAKVIVQAFFPNNLDHKEELDAARGLEKKFPGKVRTEIYETRKPDEKPEDYKKWRQTGLTCAGIMINGEDEFTVDVGDGKGPHKVLFQRAMGGMWTQVELETAVADEVKKVYGEK